MRASEVCNLRMDDVDLKRQAITVRWLKGSIDTVQPLYPHRGVPLLDEIAASNSLPYRRQRTYIAQHSRSLGRNIAFRKITVPGD